MKNLLQKSLKPLTVFAFIVFIVSIPIYFLLVDWIWLKELDENNQLIAQRIENEFNNQHISDEQLKERITFWNEIQSTGKIEQKDTQLVNQSYTVRRQNPYVEKEAIDRFRGLITNIKINNKNYSLTIETNVEESEETVGYIAFVTLLFFLVLVIGFWILNKRLSQKLWKPFQDTLQKLKSFQLSKHTKVDFSETDIIEFQELNASLEKLLQHNIATFKSQKEFTENASHELQTPLAIIKNKLDVLLQKEALTERQYQIIEDINNALMRISHINKNLLLLAKIDNNQFDTDEAINISLLIQQYLEQFEEHIESKRIKLQTNIKSNVIIQGNSTLIEMLINNLLLNAIRHNLNMGTIEVNLSKNTLQIANSGKQVLDSAMLFKRFAKASNASAGSGLGLAIIKQICNQYHWHIDYSFENKLHLFTVKFQ